MNAPGESATYGQTVRTTCRRHIGDPDEYHPCRKDSVAWAEHESSGRTWRVCADHAAELRGTDTGVVYDAPATSECRCGATIGANDDECEACEYDNLPAAGKRGFRAWVSAGRP